MSETKDREDLTEDAQSPPDGAGEDMVGAEAADAGSADAELESGATGGAEAPEAASAGGETHRTRRGREVRVMPYDFRRPVQLSKGFFRSLSMVSESFAKLLTLSLSAYLHVPVTIHVKGVRQSVFEEHTATIVNPSFINVLDLSPIKIPGMLDLDLPIAFAMIEKLLGSHTINNDLRREFTTIETRIARRIVHRILGDLREAMTRVLEIQVSLTSIEHNPDFTYIMSANDPCILLDFDVEMGEYTGPMSICVSLMALDAEIGSNGLSPYRDMRNPDEQRDDEIKLRRILASTSTEVVVELGRRSISLDEIGSLREGGIFNLRRHLDSPLTVKVGGSTIFQGRMGRYKRKAAVKLTRTVKSRD